MIDRIRDWITRCAPKTVCRDCGAPMKECGIEGLYCERCLLHGRPDMPLPDPRILFRRRLIRMVRFIFALAFCAALAVLIELLTY